MKKIEVLLSTYNGEKYLKEQLDSLQNQTYKDFEIIARDDGSCDKTLQILKSYDIKIIESTKNLGAKKSFSTLLEYAVENSDSAYFMFCDQDDVWNYDKIEKTLEKMKELEIIHSSEIPLLIHTDLEVVDENLENISNSMWEYEHILPQYNSFSRLLIQNTITGCTMMINRKLALKCLNIPAEAIMHDWWIGLVASHFGKISYITIPTIKYRQHDKNTIGAKAKNNVSTMKYILDFTYSVVKRDKEYINTLQVNIDQARNFYKIYKNELDNKTQNMLEDFCTIKEKTFLKKRIILIKYKLYKQSLNNTILLWVKI